MRNQIDVQISREAMTSKIQRAPLISRTSAEMWDYESPGKEDSRIHEIFWRLYVYLILHVSNSRLEHDLVTGQVLQLSESSAWSWRNSGKLCLPGCPEYRWPFLSWV